MNSVNDLVAKKELTRCKVYSSWNANPLQSFIWVMRPNSALYMHVCQTYQEFVSAMHSSNAACTQASVLFAGSNLSCLPAKNAYCTINVAGSRQVDS